MRKKQMSVINGEIRRLEAKKRACLKRIKRADANKKNYKGEYIVNVLHSDALAYEWLISTLKKQL